MHSAGLHSALAIKRQRKRRNEQKRARTRRYSSTESGLSSPHGSIHHLNNHQDSSVGMLHIGVVFLVLGLFLLFSGLMPDDFTSFDSTKWWNELVATGAFFTGCGIFLVVLHFIISRIEDEELNAYVESQLVRSRSGHRLERDLETGGLTTRHHRKVKAEQQSNISDFSPIEDDVLLTPTLTVITEENEVKEIANNNYPVARV